MFQLPERACPPFRNLFGFLQLHHIPFEMIKALIRQNLLYQEAKTNRAVFVSTDNTYCECMKTISYSRFSSTQVMRKAPDAHWTLSVGEDEPKQLYLCENALEAVSLMLLQCDADPEVTAIYWSMGNASTYAAAEPLLRAAEMTSRDQGLSTVLAMRKSLQNAIRGYGWNRLRTICPQNQSWNEDLMGGLPWGSN